MNKKEQAEMEHLKTLLALRHYPKIEPDMKPPERYDEIVNGYMFNSYSGRVDKAYTSGISHSYGNWDKTTSQKSCWLYSTQKLAYQAMMHDMSMEFARKLRQVEVAMEELSNEHNAHV